MPASSRPTVYVSRQVANGIWKPLPTDTPHPGEKNWETQEEAQGECDRQNKEFERQAKAEREKLLRG